MLTADDVADDAHTQPHTRAQRASCVCRASSIVSAETRVRARRRDAGFSWCAGDKSQEDWNQPTVTNRPQTLYSLMFADSLLFRPVTQ